MASPATIASDFSTATDGRSRSRFYLIVSACILLIILFGFGPSFYLRPLYEMPSETPIVFVHGGFMTLWFFILVAQTSLVASGRADIHRKLGIAGVALACVAIVLNVVVSLQFGARLASSGNVGPAPGILWGNLATLSVFSTSIALAVLCRKRPNAHRHLMLLASISMTPQALSRFPLWWPWLGGAINPLTGVAALIIVLAVYDVVTERRIHPVTIIGGGSLFGLQLLSRVVASSEFGISAIEGLG
jgi:hypothetical protein